MPETEFAPAERVTRDKLYSQNKILQNNPLALKFINSVTNLVAILNRERQIVYANKPLLTFLSLDIDDIIGKRPGEAVHCIHATETEGGCGTTKFCRECGAVNAILESQKNGSKINDCHIIQENNSALDLQVWANDIVLEGENFTIFSIADKSSENRRKVLERIFFHDIMNTAGGIKGFIELLNDAEESEKDEFIKISYQLSEKLIEEINAQKELKAAEEGDLELTLKTISSLQSLKEVRNLYVNHPVAENKIIKIDEKSIDMELTTDAPLLRRVLGNLIKNALEAIIKDEIVIIGCKRIKEDSILFFVQNSGVIPKKYQLQLFQRSFSTKGIGRGLGTYSVKLLTEKYLNGMIDFESNESSGTIFKITLPTEIDNA